MASASSGLGSLSQAARGKKLRTARGVLLFVGILTIVVNAVLFTVVESQIDKEIEKEKQALRQRGLIADPGEVQKVRAQAIRITRLVQGVAIGLGVVFVILGIIVKQFPVGATLTGLVLYIGAAAVFGMIDPATLLTGLIIKVFIVVTLIYSLQAALAYQREEREARMAAFQSDTPVWPGVGIDGQQAE
ncbi:MAG TPA: hypothetical protein VMY42_03675 [Thermoguttaceae bacterium]|nr:hypothetical protein [Thermoguttaceae bacterium]